MYDRVVLDNGLRVLTSCMPHTMSVCVCVFMGVGSRYEAPHQAGVSHFIEHLCFKGTERRPSSKEIAEAVDSVGGVLNGGTDKELTVYWTKAARAHLDVVVDVLGDMLMCSRLDPDDVENERRVIIEELNMSMDHPQNRAEILIDEVLWPGQALGRDVAGDKETVAIVDRTSILEYLASHYVAGNAVISIAGNIDHGEALGSVERVFGGWSAGERCHWLPADNSQEAPRIAVERRQTEQTHMCLALHGLPAMHRDRFVLDILNVILGEGMSSRLFLEMRERRGLAYEVHSHVNYFHDCGSVTVYAGLDQRNLEAGLEAVLCELARLRDVPVPQEELTKAKEMGKGRLLLRMEDTRNVSGWIGGQELLTSRVRTVDEVVSLVDAVTSEDVQRIAGDLVRRSQLNLALVGPVPSEERLERLLTV